MKLAVAAVQRESHLFRVADNLESADEQLRRASGRGAELVVLPELFNTGYGRLREYIPHAERADGPTWAFLRERARRYGVWIAAGFAERHDGHVFNAAGFCCPDGSLHVYRKRNLVLWESTQFRRGSAPLVVSTPFGRVGFAICADMLYRRTWRDYRDRIDLAIVVSAWPEFADARTGRPHWLLGRLGHLCGQIPERASADLGVPVVFANQCGPTTTTIPVFHQRFPDQFAGRSSICDARHGLHFQAGTDPEILVSSVTIHAPRGLKTWATMSASDSTASSSSSARSSLATSAG